jgi:ABC-2 family transporter protein
MDRRMTTATTPLSIGSAQWTRARGLGWMTWRQHRTAYLATATIFAAIALTLLINGLAMRANYRHLGLPACGPVGNGQCQIARGLFEQNYGQWAAYIPRFLLFLPGLLAAFVAAPLIAREIESGTYQFAWTQSRSRTSWLAAKVVLIIVPITAVAAGLSALFTWWFAPFEPLLGRMSAGQAYEVSGLVFALRTAFGLALGLFAGAVLRRVVAAMAVTLAAWVATTWLTIAHLRPLIERPLDLPASSPLITRGGWTTSEYFRGPGGAHLPNKGNAFSRVYAQAQQDGVTDSHTFTAWMTRHSYLPYVTYQPEERFWHFQLVETAGYLAVTLVLVAGLFWWVRKRIG